MSKWKNALRLLPLTLLVFFMTGCGEANLTALDPKGPQAQWIYDKMLLSLFVMIFVAVFVFAIFFIILIKFRRKPGDDTYPKQVHGSTTLEIIWTAIPILLLAILAVPTITGSFMMADTEPEGDHTVHIKVTGHQFWWQFDYEDEGFTAGQDVYIPVGEKVIFELHASDVQHSFWVPALGGKIDNIPGITNHLWLEADEPGIYKGKCTELCGPEHALMDFKVIALERSEYDAWVESMQARAEDTSEVVAHQGYEVFETQGCIGCHAIGGMGSDLGPALTNFGERTVVAGYLEYNDENLEAWIRDPESLKQGNNMPAYPDLSDEDMAALIAFLKSLNVQE
ncbi:cytochrome c oxidase subunit II [Alkalihalophilus pseudofirmus]|uniref:cytochrome c oxidase subunit II n=1 Tax=Alkalihalobacterium alkalinitrilicum TaxID=427920 RepID=UPI00094BEBF8|nr:cytochrome c oxidase subunit II [Alkalihalobacterium alkalinitrilicum]OLO40755.1 cytochrome c oxidase subunit II [Alkalihalophilus pseudofirmus]